VAPSETPNIVDAQAAASVPSDRPVRRSWPRRLLLSALRFVLGVVMLLMFLWMVGATYYANYASPATRSVLAVALVAGVIAWFVACRRRPWRAVIGFLVVFVLVRGAWSRLRPSNDRDWMANVAELGHAEWDDERLTVHNVRNFSYGESEKDCTINWETREYQLDDIESVDFIVSRWKGSRAMGHTFLSFGFRGGERLAISIEVRKRKGESYDPVSGLFKRFEIAYVLGDERDLIGVRTNLRDEDVYVYPTRSPPEEARALLLDILKEANELVEEPMFYNTLFPNCTTSIVFHVRRIRSRPVQFNMGMLLNGFSDEMSYERGWIPHDHPFEEMKRRSHVNERARGFGEDFSQRIRSARQ
jgi:hypothetical protein